MKIVTPDTEPLSLKRAWIGNIDGRPSPLAEIDGRICSIETKDSLLQAGIASCVPLETGDQDWPHAVQILEEGSEDVRTIWDATTDLRVLAAAQQWAKLADQDDLTPGTSLL